MADKITAGQNLAEFFAQISGAFSIGLVETLSALLTPTIAILGTYIAIRQWQLARENFRERLFDRRFKLLNLALDLYLETYLGDPNGQRLRDLSAEFGETRRQAEFILDKDIAAALEQMHEACDSFRRNNLMISRASNPATHDKLSAKIDAAKDEMHRVKEALPRMFARYLTIGKNF